MIRTRSKTCRDCSQALIASQDVLDFAGHRPWAKHKPPLYVGYVSTALVSTVRVRVECDQQYLRTLVKGMARHIRTVQLWMSPEPKHSQTLNPHVRLRHGPSLCRRHSTSLLLLSARYRPAVVMAPESEGEQSPMQTSRSATQAGANT